MSTTSALTTLTATPSSPHSFHTAKSTSPLKAEESVTETSSPIGLPQATAAPPPYREARQLPRELQAHCGIHLEEQLYQSALHNLNILHTAGGSRRPGAPVKPAFVPPPSQIALLGTLIIHPSFTTRPAAAAAAATATTPTTSDHSHAEVASQALQLLRSLLHSVGPLHANMRAAFEFHGASSSSGVGRSRSAARRNPSGGRGGGGSGSGDEFAGAGGGRGGGGSDSGESDSGGGGGGGNGERVRGRIANEHSVWRRGADFWAVVGWAFNCAALWPARWRYWRVWLSVMLDVLEADWEERARLDAEDQKRQGPFGGGGGTAAGFGRQVSPSVSFPRLEDSLLMAYINRRRGEGRTFGVRTIMRALFADGNPADVAVFPEVFERETAAPSRSKRKRAQTLDLENDHFGDYLDGDDDSLGSAEEADPSRQDAPKKRRGRGLKEPMPLQYQTSVEGMEESVPLRLRLFGLLALVSDKFPQSFAPMDDLYNSFSDSIRGLPIAIFAQFVSSNTPLQQITYTSLLRILVDKMLPSSAPDPATVDEETDAYNGISVPMLEHCFLPFAANNNSVDSNAKLSLVLEHMVRWIWVLSSIPYSEGLRDAVEKGVQARNDKTRRRKNARAAMDEEETATRAALADSTRGLLALLDVIEADAESDV